MSPRYLGWSAPDGGWPEFDERGRRVRSVPDVHTTSLDDVIALCGFTRAELEDVPDVHGECDVATCHRPATVAVIGECGDLYLCDLHGTKA